MKPEKQFAELVRNARLKSGLTNEEFAKKAGAPAVSLWRYEKMCRVPTIVSADKILKSLGLSMTIGAGK
jgi:ribosome-binding protein aMBF1 (putative translation factor)